jgi:FkbM family methyltransferase
MKQIIKKFIFNLLGTENYLRLLQNAFFFAYKTGLLKNNSVYYCHYYAKRLVKKGDTVLDIGANLGYYSLLFAEWTGKKGKVFSVEPIPLYNKIFNEKARKHANITLYPYALGTEERQIQLVTSPQSDVLQTGMPHVYNSDTDGNITEYKFRFEASMKIPSVLFGDLERLDYIKCDIEGYEFIVLSDMKEIIRRLKPIVQVEVWAKNEPAIRTMFDELGYSAYKVIKRELVLQTESTSEISGDYIFIPNQ